MGTRRHFLVAAGALLACRPAAAALRQRIVIFIGTNEARAASIRRAWIDWFAADGMADGRDVSVEVVNAGMKDDPEHEEYLARQVVASRPAVICVPGSWMDMFARLTRDIPLVFRLVADPVKNGYVRSLSRPGGNVTGVTSPYLDLLQKRLELLKEIRPAIRRVALLARDDYLGGAMARSLAAASRLGIIPVGVPLSIGQMNSARGEEIVRAATGIRADAFNVGMIDDVVPADLLTYFRRASIPAMFDEVQTVERGGLACVGEALLGTHRRSYRLALKVLRGEKVGTIPVDQQAEFHIALNLGTARAMGLEIPDSVRIRAQQLVA